MPEPLTTHRPVVGIMLKLSAIFLFTFMAAIVKYTSDQVPPGEAVFFRSFFAIPVILIWLAFRGELPGGLKAKKPLRHVWRGILGTSAMGLTFTGLGLLPLPEVTAIGFATPIFTLILAALILGERIRLIRISAVLIGLVGVSIMLWPRLSGSGDLQDGATMGALFILIATIARSLVQVQIRVLVQSESTAAIVFYFSVIASVVSLLTLPFGWTLPSLDVILILMSTGVMGGIAQILVTAAYRYGPASMLAPYDYSSMIFAVIVGYVWFGELPTAVILIGGALVIAGNAVVILRERQLGLDRRKARSVTDPKSG
ncbi:MAG: DMT family transporter [Paracoccaceae bacterium]